MHANINNDLGHKLTTIATKKFKTTVIKVAFKAPLERKTITSRILLANVLRNSSKKYPTKKAFNTHLEELYGTHLSVSANKQGQAHTLKFYLSIANEKFLLSEPELLEAGIETLGEMLFNPLVNGNAFSDAVLDLEKRLLKEEIDATYDDKTSYAVKKLVSHMCQDEKFGVTSTGYISDFASIITTSLYETYQSMLNHDAISISIVGDVEHEALKSMFVQKFELPKSSTESKVEAIDSEEKLITHVERVSETQSIAQAKLNIGYRTHTRINDEAYFALMVFNGIFGAFAHSKLFMNVREKHSLCYYCTSRVDSFKGLMYVYSGLDFKNCEMAEKIIDEQLKDIMTGNFTDKEMDLAKKSIINAKLESLDSALGMITEQEVNDILGYELSATRYAQKINAVTKEEVQKIAKRMIKDTVFTLTKEGV